MLGKGEKPIKYICMRINALHFSCNRWMCSCFAPTVSEVRRDCPSYAAWWHQEEWAGAWGHWLQSCGAGNLISTTTGWIFMKMALRMSPRWWLLWTSWCFASRWNVMDLGLFPNKMQHWTSTKYVQKMSPFSLRLSQLVPPQTLI